MTPIAELLHHPQRHHPDLSMLRYACRITENVALCIGPLKQPLTGKERIALDGLPAEKPYLAARLTESQTESGHAETAMLLAVDGDYALDGLQEVTFADSRGLHRWSMAATLDEQAAQLDACLQVLAPADRAKILFLLLKWSARHAGIAQDAGFVARCVQVRRSLTQGQSPATFSCWLNPSALYLETVLPACDESGMRLIAIGAGLRAAPALTIELGEQANGLRRVGLMAVAKTDWTQTEECQFVLMSKDRLVALGAPATYDLQGMSTWLHYLRQMPEARRWAVRDFAARCLKDHTPAERHELARQSVRLMQHYLAPEPSSLHDPAQPFGMNIELAAPVAGEGIVLCGWLFDPMQLWESAELLLDNGEEMAVTLPDIRLPRPDVQALYADSVYRAPSDRFGFVQMIAPRGARGRLGFVDPFAMRLRVTLKGGLRFTLTPKQQDHAPQHVLTMLRERVLPFVPMGDAAEAALSSLLATLRHQAAQQVRVMKTEHFGQPVAQPEMSILWPAGEAEALRARLATLAVAENRASVEVIVMAADDATRDSIASFHALHGLPVTLLQLSQAASDAVAWNLAAGQARAPLLLFAAGESIPADNKALRLLNEYAYLHQEAALIVPKILHPDRSIAAAGYAADKVQRAAPRARYAGYPERFAPAGVSGPVVAGGSECLAVRSDLFARAGRFAFDYGDSHASAFDLSLKIRRAGAQLHYCAPSVWLHAAPRPVQDWLRYDTPLLAERWRRDLEAMEADHG